MDATSKGKSPFYPGQPVPIELFVGRRQQIDHVIQRGVMQVAQGKPIAVYVQGEYGIGKSSIAGFLQSIAEHEHDLHAIYTPLGTAQDLDGAGAAILEATIRSGAFLQKRADKVRDWLTKYIGEQSLFGLTLHLDALKRDAPSIAAGLLPFLQEVHARLEDTGVKGIFLVLDEINGLAQNPQFAQLVKGLVDTNAMSRKPLPLLLMLCGVEERRREMIQNLQPIDRIFDVVEIGAMTIEEMKDFFQKAFESVKMTVEPEAMEALSYFSAGLPKIMHLLGDAAYWIDRDGVVSREDADNAVLAAAEEVGRKYVDHQVYGALRSADYRSILKKIATQELDMRFNRKEAAEALTETERKKLDNFIQKMKQLKVIRQGGVKGEWIFTSRMTRVYIWLQSRQDS